MARTIREIFEIGKQNPGDLTPTELAAFRKELKRLQKGDKADKEDAEYVKKKAASRKRQQEVTKAGQDIGPIPEPVNLERKAAACDSLRVFCETYFPHRFYLGWSEDHLQVLARFEDAILRGGLYALAMPRASGKTSIAECASLWAMMNGSHKFILLIGSSREHALEMLQSIKGELTSNDMLGDDFPEVCFPINALEDRANRCKGQHTEGRKTSPVWSTDRIVLPTVEGSRASGAAIRVTGITGRIRGAKKDTTRPSLALLDDPQTDESAASVSQCEKRHKIVMGAVLGLAGPGQKIAAIMPCTVIRQGDLADTVLDREKSPQWAGHKFKLVYEFPKNTNLWDQYATMRNDEFRNDGDGTEATKFYAANREAMDMGAVVAWPERYNPDEISGVQYAMNLMYQDRWAFFAEYQNSPLSEDLGDGQLDAKAVGGRVNGIERGVIPLWAAHITAFVDVQQSILFYVVCAWADDFTGAIVDYGTWPDQGRRYFTVGDVQKTIAREFPTAGLEGQIHGALGRIADFLLDRGWARQDGASLRIGRMLVDAGFQTEAVKNWARNTHHAAIVLPSHGHGVSAASKPWEEYDRTRCEKLGTHWMIPKVDPARKSGRHVSIDTNFWKTFVAARLKQSMGDKGALSIWGKAGQDHRMLADHLCAEYGIDTEGRGRRLREWRLRPGMSENHWWDGVVGCAVGASMLGATLLGQEKPAGPRKVIDVRAEQAKRRAEFEAKRQYRG